VLFAADQSTFTAFQLVHVITVMVGYSALNVTFAVISNINFLVLHIPVKFLAVLLLNTVS